MSAPGHRWPMVHVYGGLGHGERLKADETMCVRDDPFVDADARERGVVLVHHLHVAPIGGDALCIVCGSFSGGRAAMGAA